MLDELFNMIDENVLTEDVKRDLQAAFDDAVNKKAEIIAENSIFEERERLNAEYEEKLNFLNEKCDEYKQNLEDELNKKKEEYEEKINDLDEKSDKYSDYVNDELMEKAEEYVEEVKKELNEKIDNYLKYVVDEFISESKEKFENDLIVERARALNASFNNFAYMAGVDLAKTSKNTNDVNMSYKNEIDKLTNENIKLKNENNKLIQEGVILEMCDGLTDSQASRFTNLAKKLVKFERSLDYKDKLEDLKESVCKFEQETPKIKQREKLDENFKQKIEVKSKPQDSKPRVLFNSRFI